MFFDSYAKNTILNSIKTLLCQHTISKLSELYTISQEETVSNTSNHTQQEKENAEIEIDNIFSNIDIDNLAEIYPLISKAAIKSHGKPVDLNTLPLISERVTKEIIKQVPNFLITKDNKETYKKLYEAMTSTTPKYLSTNNKTLDAEIFKNTIYSTYKTAKANINSAAAHNCMDMIDIMTEVDVTNLVNTTKDFLSGKEEYNEDDIATQFSSLYNKFNKFTTSTIIENMTNKQLETYDKINPTQEELDSASITIDACNYILDIKKDFDKNQTSTNNTNNLNDNYYNDGANDDNVM